MDLVGIGRQSVADPLFAKKILSGETDKVNFCTACGGCTILLRSQKEVGCTVYNEYYKNIFNLAQKHKLSIYDCSYIILAESLDCNFYTADKRLYDKLKGRLSFIKFITDFKLLKN